jgi:hypothetical protein
LNQGDYFPAGLGLKPEVSRRSPQLSAGLVV